MTVRELVTKLLALEIPVDAEVFMGVDSDGSYDWRDNPVNFVRLDGNTSVILHL